MPDAIVGTNTEKIDQLSQPLTDVRATLRACYVAMTIGCPLLASLVVFLVVQSFTLSARLDRLGDRLDAINSQLASVKELDRELRDQRERILRLESGGGHASPGGLGAPSARP